MRFDMVIHNGIIITANTQFDIIDNGLVCITAGRIQRIEAADPQRPLPETEKTIDASGCIVMPGLVNAHTHLPMTLFRGLADDLPLLEWLHEHIFPAESRHIHPESVRLGTLLGCAEMILSGTTTCCDGYFYENEVASAVYESGIRAVLGQGVIDFPAPGVPDPTNNIKYAEAFLDRWQGVSPLISPSIFCHSPYTCSAATLKTAKAVARSRGLLFQVHAAETKAEWDQIQSEQKRSPIRYLDSIGVLDEKTLLVHGVWVDDTDIEIIAKRRASVVHNPESNMMLGSGIAPIPEYLASGISVGLGTDGCASNNNLDLFQEMDFAAKLHKVKRLDPTAIDAGTVIKMATIGGAKAIGLHESIGSLEAGKQADLIIIDMNKPHLIPMYNPVSHIVYAAGGSDVRDVIVGGTILLRERKLMTMDINEILKRAVSFAKSIRHSPSNSVKANTL